MHDQAATALEKAMALSGDERVFVSSRGYALAGNTDIARKILAELPEETRHAYVPSHRIALLYARLGQKDQALHWLEKAYEERDGRLPFLAVNPTVDALCGDPQFDDLLRRIGLEAPSIPAEQTP